MPTMNPMLRLALDIGPLVLFFVVNAYSGIFAATAAFMAAMVISISVSYAVERRVAPMPLVIAGFVLVFGGLTLILEDDTFIKLKPTIVNGLFALGLFGGLAFRRNLLQMAFQSAFRMDDLGWRILTWRWAWFFVVLAVINEIVWRTQSTDFWVSFKLFGIMPLTIVFTLVQVRLISRHIIDEEETPA